MSSNPLGAWILENTLHHGVVHQDRFGPRWNFVLTFDPVIQPLIDWPWADRVR